MYITVHTCINKCSWWVFDWHQPSQQWNCDTLYTTISWLYYIILYIIIYIYILVCVCVWCVCVPWFSQSGPQQPLQGYKADVHAETPFGWSVLVYAALSDQVRGLGVAKGTGSTRRMLDIFLVWCCMNLIHVDLIRVIHARNWECCFHVFFKIQPSLRMYQVVSYRSYTSCK